MTAVVSDAGPLIHLSQISQLHRLHRLFGDVLITEKVKFEVCDEGLKLHYADAAAIASAVEDRWLKVEIAPKHLAASAAKLAVGENISKVDAECLFLAVDKRAELLVDDKLFSSLAKMYGLKVWSTWTLMLEAVSRKLVTLDEVKAAVEMLGKRKFKLNPRQAQEVLDAAKLIEESKKDKKS